MDPKMIEINNLRVLHDYLNQTLDVLSRGQRFGVQGAGFAHTPFAGGLPQGTDVVYGASPYTMTGAPFGVANTPFLPMSPFGGVYPTSLQGFGGYTPAVDPFFAQRGIGGFGGWQQSWGQIAETARQAQITQALCAKQSVLEALCRCCGIPV